MRRGQMTVNLKFDGPETRRNGVGKRETEGAEEFWCVRLHIHVANGYDLSFGVSPVALQVMSASRTLQMENHHNLVVLGQMEDRMWVFNYLLLAFRDLFAS